MRYALGRFLMLWPALPRVVRITSDVVRGMRVRGLNWGWAHSKTKMGTLLGYGGIGLIVFFNQLPIRLVPP